MSPQERIAELEEQVAFLRSELGLTADAVRSATLSERLGCTHAEASILLQLYDAGGKCVRGYWLAENTPSRFSRGDRDGNNIASVLICRLRAKVGRDIIKTYWSRGFGITDEGRAVVERALARQAARDAA